MNGFDIFSLIVGAVFVIGTGIFSATTNKPGLELLINKVVAGRKQKYLHENFQAVVEAGRSADLDLTKVSYADVGILLNTLSSLHGDKVQSSIETIEKAVEAEEFAFPVPRVDFLKRTFILLDGLASFAQRSKNSEKLGSYELQALEKAETKLDKQVESLREESDRTAESAIGKRGVRGLLGRSN